MKHPHHSIQFFFFLALLVSVLVQGLTGWIPMKPLGGFTEQLKPVEPSWETYHDGSYQDYLTKYAKLHTGFREFFIRNYNQVAYTCFNKITNNTIEKGLNNELYNTLYLKHITGEALAEEHLTVELAKAQAQKDVEATLAFIDTLRNHGTDFLVVFAPSKTEVYPEYMPRKYRRYLPCFSMEQYYIELYKEKGIPHIDFLNYFIDLKDKFPYPLYAKTGTHWSEATIPMVADSLFRKIEALTGHKMPSIEVIDLNISTDYSYIDDELEESLNLLFPFPKPPLPNPVFTLRDTADADRINLLVVSDSYFNQLRRSCFVDAFRQWDLWFYNMDIYSSRKFYNGKHLNMVFDAGEVIEDADLVLVMFTSAYLPDYMFGFIPYALEQLREGHLNDEAAINQIISNMKNNPQWFKAIEEQAVQRGITLEENLRQNAEYVLQHNKKAKLEQQQ